MSLLRHSQYNRNRNGAAIPIPDYTPLWKTLAKKNISQNYLLQNGIGNKTLDALKKKKYHPDHSRKAVPDHRLYPKRYRLNLNTLSFGTYPE